NYMGWKAWNCMVDDLWPGNDLVDWIIWDPYGDNNLDFSGSVSPFYNFLASSSDADHDYLSKPWGLGEFGTIATTTAAQHSYYAGIKSALDSGVFPRLKLLSVFDCLGTNGDDRIRYDSTGNVDPGEVSQWTALASDPNIDQLG